MTISPVWMPSPGGSSPTATRVLVIEDDPIWRRIIGHTLAKHDVAVTDAASLAEAEAILSTNAFDLVLLDYELPDGQGLDILDRSPRAHVGRVVLVTGYADSYDLEDSRASSIDGYLTKPFLSSDLTAFLHAPCTGKDS